MISSDIYRHSISDLLVNFLFSQLNFPLQTKDMLTSLLIKNYALIQELELNPSGGLNIITGETGAGKSIMLGALGLLLGNRADGKALFNQGQKCIVEGVFEVEGYGLESFFEAEELDYHKQCIIRREISPSGKSRAFINDTPVNLEIQKKIGTRLMDIHSQHDTLLLGASDFQLDLLDLLSENQHVKSDYREIFLRYKSAVAEHEKLRNEAARLRKDFDYYNFLFTEIEQVALIPDEQEKLEAELAILENTSELKEKLAQAHFMLDNPELAVLEQFKMVVSNLSQTARITEEYRPLYERAQSSLIELKDLAEEIGRSLDSLESNPEREMLIKERLDRIYVLFQKHQVDSVSGLIDLQNQFEEKIEKTVNIDDELEKAEKLAASLHKEVLEKAELLHRSRIKITPDTEKSVIDLLSGLGMPDARLKIEIQPVAPGPSGADLVRFMFSANKGSQLQELKNVASGGEFSRIMLVFKYIMAGKTKLPTIIFDEIDTGISGEVAVRMGRMIRQMSRKHQVIAITHLHQIAAQGDRHYFVYKDNSGEKTISRIRQLNEDERIFEVASMIGGEDPTEGLLENTRQLMEQYRTK